MLRTRFTVNTARCGLSAVELLHAAEMTVDRISQARDALANETFTRGKPRANKKTGVVTPPKEYTRTGATVNRYIGCLSHALSFAVKERRLIARNPVSDISRKKEPKAGAQGTATLQEQCDAFERRTYRSRRALRHPPRALPAKVEAALHLECKGTDETNAAPKHC
jgi:hypothetical protein